MRSFQVGLPLVMFAGWLVAAGCEADIGAVDIGAGGTAFFAGAPNAGDGGKEAGGNGGAGGAAECPGTIFGLDGEPCTVPGMVCSDGADDPCSFGHAIVCIDGKWEDQESFPAPCGGAGGAPGAGGAADAGGAAGATP
jgi:hypothetical protein